MIIYYLWRNSHRVYYKKLFRNFTDNWQDGYWPVVCTVQFIFTFKYRQNFSSFETLREKSLGQGLFFEIREYWGKGHDICFKYVSWDVIPSNNVAILIFFYDFRYLVNGCLMKIV